MEARRLAQPPPDWVAVPAPALAPPPPRHEEATEFLVGFPEEVEEAGEQAAPLLPLLPPDEGPRLVTAALAAALHFGVPRPVAAAPPPQNSVHSDLK